MMRFKGTHLHSNSEHKKNFIVEYRKNQLARRRRVGKTCHTQFTAIPFNEIYIKIYHNLLIAK